MYHQLIPSSQLDITMLTEWGRTNIQELFENNSEGNSSSDDSADGAASEHSLTHQGSVHTTTGEIRTLKKRKSGF